MRQPWTDYEVSRVRQLLKQGLTYNEIAMRLERSYDSVKGRIAEIAATDRTKINPVHVDVLPSDSFIRPPSKARLMAGR